MKLSKRDRLKLAEAARDRLTLAEALGDYIFKMQDSDPTDDQPWGVYGATEIAHILGFADELREYIVKELRSRRRELGHQHDEILRIEADLVAHLDEAEQRYSSAAEAA